MGIADKFMNDWVYATSRYIDDKGYVAPGNRLEKFLSAPLFKKSVLLGGASTLGFVALNDQTMAATAAANAIIWPCLHSGALAVKDKLFNRPEFYFDTKPDRKIPVDNSEILHTLHDDKRFPPTFTLGAAGIIAGLVTGNVIVNLLGISTTSASSILTHSTITAMSLLHVYNSYAGRVYRAEKALNGEWNVLKENPEHKKTTQAQPETILMPEYVPA